MIEQRPAAAPGVIVPLYGLMVLVLVVYAPAARALFSVWMDPGDTTNRHGPLIAAISIWLIYNARRELSVASVRPFAPACLPLFACSIASVILWRAALQDAYLVLVPVILWLTVLAAYGRDVGRLLAFPITYSYFAMPAWGSVSGLLQFMTVHVVGFLTQLAGVSVSIVGNILKLPAGQFEINSGCSGSHYLVVGLALAALIGELERATVRHRMRLLALMTAFALLCNWLRVLIIVAAGEMTHMRHPLVTVGHYWLGWWLFAGFFTLFLWVAFRFPRATPPAPPPEDRVPAKLPVKYGPQWVAFLVASVSPLVAYAAAAARPAPSLAAANLPSGHGTWSGSVAADGSSWQPHFVGVHTHSRATYVDGSGRTLEMIKVFYSEQRQDSELVNWSNSLLGAALREENQRVIAVVGGTFRQTTAVDSIGRRSVIWSVYDIGGHRFVEPLLAQLWYGTHAIFNAPGSALLAYRASCSPSCDYARETLERFVRAEGQDE